MSPIEKYTPPTPTGKKKVAKAKAEKKATSNKVVASRASEERHMPFSHERDVVTVGIDPGSRYTAMVILEGETVVRATTVTRVGDEEPIPYARRVVTQLQEEVAEYLKNHPSDVTPIIGIEGVTDPKGFKHGKRAAINPKDIVRTGVTAGALAIAFADSVIVPPGNNGSRHISQYPGALIGRRPVDLAGNSKGAGTRRHEQSAYDVAVKARDISTVKNLPQGE